MSDQKIAKKFFIMWDLVRKQFVDAVNSDESRNLWPEDQLLTSSDTIIGRIVEMQIDE
jgi:hypothetical protein